MKEKWSVRMITKLAFTISKSSHIYSEYINLIIPILRSFL